MHSIKKFYEILESEQSDIQDFEEGKSGVERKYQNHLNTIGSNIKEVKKLVKQEKYKDINFCLEQCKKEIDNIIKFNKSMF